jgi:hypothetical protein
MLEKTYNIRIKQYIERKTSLGRTQLDGFPGYQLA